MDELYELPKYVQIANNMNFKKHLITTSSLMLALKSAP